MVKASVLYICSIYNPFEIKQTSLSGRPTTLELKKFQDFLNSMGLILNSIQGQSFNYYSMPEKGSRKKFYVINWYKIST